MRGRTSMVMKSVIASLMAAAASWGQTSGGPPPEEGSPPDVSSSTPAPEERPARRKPYPSTKSPAANRLPDRPSYVKTLDRVGEEFHLESLKTLHWLEIGIEHRTRFEMRDDFYPEGLESDDYFTQQTRFFLGVRDIMDPFRVGAEFQDARRFGGDFPEGTGEVDEADLLQLFGELHFKDVPVGGGREPVSFRFGRMSFDAIDRRLVARNRYRNTTNAFDGFRLRVGDQSSTLEIDAFAMMPVERRVRQFDRPDHQRWLYGVTTYWRGWSPHLTLEPYYLILDEDFTRASQADREIHSLGLHGFGLIGKSGFDYDFNVTFQWGSVGTLSHRAFASHAELGYTFDHAWKPRLGAFVNYATGDGNPADSRSERFDSLFGASFMFYGFSGLFSWQNMINPTLHLSLKPTDKLRLDALYRVYWLESERDAFIRARRVDPTGGSGHFAGQALEARLQYQLSKHVDFDVVYSHFMPGDFTTDTGDPTDDSDYFYVQCALKL